MMNYRLEYYMFRNPEREDWMKKDEEIAALPIDEDSSPPFSGRRGGVLGKTWSGKTWKKSLKLGRGMFKA